MMNDELFKTVYIASEDEVPVNDALKRRMLELAEKYEKGELTPVPQRLPIKSARKKNIRNIVIRTAAAAACFVMCLYPAKELKDYRIDTPENTEAPQPTPTVTENIADSNAGKLIPQKPDSKPDKNTEEESGFERKYSAPNEVPHSKTNYENQTATGVRENNRVIKTETKTVARENAAAVPDPSETAKQDNTVKIIKGTEQREIDETHASRDEYNRRYDELGRQRAKLEAWDSEMSMYCGTDENFDSLYTDFASNRDAYYTAADEYEETYTQSCDEEELAEGISRYDENLGDSGTLFDSCRESYRKSSNYAEIYCLGEDTEVMYDENESSGGSYSGCDVHFDS